MAPGRTALTLASTVARSTSFRQSFFSSISVRSLAFAAGQLAQRQAQAMPIESSMRQKLTQQFQPSSLLIRNDSSKHAHHAAMVAQGGGSGETHFFVEIVSQAFDGKPQIARHRAINALMADEFKQGLHALSLRTKTPSEVEREKQLASGIHN